MSVYTNDICFRGEVYTPNMILQIGKGEGLVAHIKQTYQKYYRIMGRQGKYPHASLNYPEFQEVSEIVWRGNKDKEIPNDTWLFTINPSPGVTWRDLLLLWLKLKGSKNLFVAPKMCLEQRSLDVLKPQGFHMHIAATLNGSPASQIKQRMFNFYALMFDDAKAQVIHYSRNPNAYKYVEGDKIPDDKLAKVKVDRILRKKLSFDSVYQ